MTSFSFRRFCAVALLAVVSLAGLRAQTAISGATYVDFDAGGFSHYHLSFYADVVVGGAAFATAYAGYGDFVESSYSHLGEAGVSVAFENIQKLNGQWVATTATVSVFDADTGAYETTVYYSVPLDAAGYVFGEAECDDYVQAVRGSITGF